MILLAVFFHCLLAVPPVTGGPVVQLEITNIQSTKGMIWVGIYDSQDNFLVKEKAIVKGYEVPHTGRMRIPLPDLPFGTYALAVFHDLNNNGVLDQNLIGIPSEPFAFSRKPPSKFRVPNYKEVTYSFTPRKSTLTMKLEKWWKQ